MNKGAYERKVKRVAVRAMCGGLIVLGLAAVGSTGVPSRVADAVEADLFSLLEERSPGVRPDGALTQSKPIKAAAPTERVLSSVRRRPGGQSAPTPASPPGPGSLIAGPLTGPEAPSFLAFNGIPSVPLDATSAVGQGPGGSSPGFGFGGVPFVVSGPGGGNPATSPSPVPEVASAVPEPATWITFLLGFGIVGLVLRTRSDSRRLSPFQARSSDLRSMTGAPDGAGT